ncbi:MAG: 4-hydroxy-tetrahydrodipicolinate reductase [Synergistaceae bacterium]|nr:4-hydroxy-tetrahydrodipicolinate reductase [Synergistaceae bacterium]
MMKVVINGACGRMGSEILSMLKKDPAGLGATLAAAVDVTGIGRDIYSYLAEYTEPADVIIDFTFHTTALELTEYAISRNLPVVIATTGHTKEELAVIRKAALNIPIFQASNMSIGVALLIEFARQAAHAFPKADIEIVEKHHNRKKDAPSGTAMTIADALSSIRPGSVIKCGRSGFETRDPNEITIHSLRMGDIVGDHEVYITTDTQQLALRHEAYSRTLFAEGAICAAKFLLGKPAGYYTMEDMIR